MSGKEVVRALAVAFAIVFTSALLLGLASAACVGVFSVLFGAGAPLVRATLAAQGCGLIGGCWGLVFAFRVFLEEWKMFISPRLMGDDSV